MTSKTCFAAEVERTTGDLAALCRRSFGPCGEETLLFRPPEPPIVTGEGHAVLAAWKQGLDAEDPMAKLLLTAADGVHKQLGDGSSEFILLVDAAARHAAESLSRRHGNNNAVERARLSRAFGELKWGLQREMGAQQSPLTELQLMVPIELDVQAMQTSNEFREATMNILLSALRGVLGDRAVGFVADLVLKWVFPAAPDHYLDARMRTDELLFRRVQQFLKCAPDAIIFMSAPSVYASYVVPRDEFILKKSVVASQPPRLLERCQAPVRFVCFTCPLSLSAGSNNVELATSTSDELFTAQDAVHLFISKFVRHLRDFYHVQLLVCTEALDESVIATCTRQDIACVHLAEPEDVEALCMSSGISSLASLFDDIRTSDHVGVCGNGVSRARLQQQSCLRLRGLTIQRHRGEGNQERQAIGVPQLLVHSPTKGVYKQYYAAIVKCLRVLQSWWEPHKRIPTTAVDVRHSQQPAVVLSCRGGGATELSIARWLQDESYQVSRSATPRDPAMLYLARQTLANALIEVVSVLRSNLSRSRFEAGGEGDQRHVLLDAFSNLTVKDGPHAYPGYTLDYSRVIETLAGPIQIPEVVLGDPKKYGLVHPWRRIDTLLFLVLQTLEQLFRIDGLFSRNAAPTNKSM